MKGNLYIVMGKSATGKDTLYARIRERHPELLPVIPYTTRPIREGEQEGEEYHFVDETTMHTMENEKKIIESRCYHTMRGDWYYFTAADEQLEGEDDHIMITTLEGYEQIRDYFGGDCVIPIYIEVDDVTRIERALGREKKEETPCISEVCRRYLADDEDFSEERLAQDGITRRVINRDLEEAVEQIEAILRG
ncbi:MAG: guanylate kinase [Eubacterium sp.]|nr:guanylate kinase [Eubacterium sp.]